MTGGPVRSFGQARIPTPSGGQFKDRICGAGDGYLSPKSTNAVHRLYVSDTNIWIDFGHAGLLDALFALPLTFVSTDFVMDELKHPEPAALLCRGLVLEALDEAAVAQLFELMDQHHNSSLADVSCYLVAKTHGRPLLTGDGGLRKRAAKDGLEVRGALWLLDQLVAHNITDTTHAAAALRAMLGAGARLPQADCADRLAAWQA